MLPAFLIFLCALLLRHVTLKLQLALRTRRDAKAVDSAAALNWFFADEKLDRFSGEMLGSAEDQTSESSDDEEGGSTDSTSHTPEMDQSDEELEKDAMRDGEEDDTAEDNEIAGSSTTTEEDEDASQDQAKDTAEVALRGNEKPIDVKEDTEKGYDGDLSQTSQSLGSPDVETSEFATDKETEQGHIDNHTVEDRSAENLGLSINRDPFADAAQEHGLTEPQSSSSQVKLAVNQQDDKASDGANEEDESLIKRKENHAADAGLTVNSNHSDGRQEKSHGVSDYLVESTSIPPPFNHAAAEVGKMFKRVGTEEDADLDNQAAGDHIEGDELKGDTEKKRSSRDHGVQDEEALSPGYESDVEEGQAPVVGVSVKLGEDSGLTLEE